MERVSERASEPASLVGWIMERAQATRPSSRLLPARGEVIYLPDGVYPNTQDATNEVYLGKASLKVAIRAEA